MKKIFAIFAALALGVTLVAEPVCARRVLRLAHGAAQGNPRDVAAKLFSRLVREKSDGRIEVDVGSNAQYGDDVEALTSMRLGALAFSANSQGPVSGVVPQFGVLGLPFLFQGLHQAWQVLDGPVGRKLGELAERKGLVLLTFWDNGIRHVSNNVRPIEAPDDLKGIKLRTPPDPVTIQIFQALGANPIPMSFSELYIALQEGVVDGQENPLMNIYSSKLYEVQKYLSLTGHKYEATPVLASKVVWDGLPPEDRKAIRAAAVEAGKTNRKLSLESDKKLRAEMEKAGVVFNAVDRAPFIEATQAVYEAWMKHYPNLTRLVRNEAVAAARQDGR